MKNKNNPFSESAINRIYPRGLPEIVVHQGTAKKVKLREAKIKHVVALPLLTCAGVAAEEIKNTFDIIKSFITILEKGG